MLAQIDAISGIYTAFFPVFIYILLGTSRHISMGKFIIFIIAITENINWMTTICKLTRHIH